MKKTISLLLISGTILFLNGGFLDIAVNDWKADFVIFQSVPELRTVSVHADSNPNDPANYGYAYVSIHAVADYMGYDKVLEVFSEDSSPNQSDSWTLPVVQWGHIETIDYEISAFGNDSFARIECY